jgi:hypothetical protein
MDTCVIFFSVPLSCLKILECAILQDGGSSLAIAHSNPFLEMVLLSEWLLEIYLFLGGISFRQLLLKMFLGVFS